jgi:hypothetical protein
MRYSMDRSFETANFQRNKEFAYLSLGLIYDSMTLSQPQSRDTAPQKHFNFNFPFYRVHANRLVYKILPQA